MITLNSLGVKHQHIIKGSRFFIWVILCVDMMPRDLIMKVYIIRTEYQGRRRTKVGVYEVPDYVLREHLGVYLM